jgi:hypothetical protein
MGYAAWVTDNYMGDHKKAESLLVAADDADSVRYNRIHRPDDRPEMASSESRVVQQAIGLEEHTLALEDTKLTVADPFLEILRTYNQVIPPISNLLS